MSLEVNDYKDTSEEGPGNSGGGGGGGGDSGGGGGGGGGGGVVVMMSLYVEYISMTGVCKKKKKGAELSPFFS